MNTVAQMSRGKEIQKANSDLDSMTYIAKEKRKVYFYEKYLKDMY